MKGLSYWYSLGALLISIGSFFIFISSAGAANTDIVINEIAAYPASSCEWIELFNKGSTAVNIEKWKFWEDTTNHGLTISVSSTQSDWLIEPVEYAIIAEDDKKLLSPACGTYQPPAGTLFDSSWATLNETGELIGLRDNTGVLVESFTYVPAATHSLERKDPNVSDYTVANWFEHPTGNSFGRPNQASLITASSSSFSSSATASTTLALTVSPGLRLNEFLSDSVTGALEWIELYNPTAASVPLTGWTVRDGIGLIASPTGTMPAAGFFVITLSSSKLNNGGDAIQLLDPSGSVVDAVSYGDWNDGNVSDNAIAPAKGNSSARRSDGVDTNNDKNDWAETITPTPGAANRIIVPPPPIASSGVTSHTSGGSNSPVSAPVLPHDVVINELLGDPLGTGAEFVELFNNTSDGVILNGWALEDGGGSKTSLFGAIAAKGFFVIDNPIGHLDTSGERLRLVSPTGREIDRVIYGDWGRGTDTHAPALPPGISLSRKIDGRDTDHDQDDFVLTSVITKGRPNSTTGVFSLSSGTADHAVVLNELLPNPVGSDEAGEFIELKNISPSTVDISSWKIVSGSQTAYTLGAQSLAAGAVLALPRGTTHVVLRNAKNETVKLERADGSLADEAKYTDDAKPDVSWARDSSGRWQWTIRPTPGAENIFVHNNKPPIIAIDADSDVGVNEAVTFDASDTVDPDGDDLAFHWIFADGHEADGEVVEHQFALAGVYHVVLQVTEAGGQTTEKSMTIQVKRRQAFAGGWPDMATLREAWQTIRIAKVYPNPDSGQTEFIELANSGDDDVDISGLRLDDREGGSLPYSIRAGTVIAPHDRLVLERGETKLALNNTGDSVRLLLPDGSVLQTVTYKNSPRDASYAQNAKGAWVWTTTATPVKESSVSGGKVSVAIKTIQPAKPVNLRYAVGSYARITGLVAVLPGVLGAQYFYLAYIGSPGGMQVYMPKKNWPPLAVGDMVTVSGVIRLAKGEEHLLVRSPNDFIIKKTSRALVPSPLNLGVIDEKSTGGLVQVSGEITQKTSGDLYVDDGMGEIRVVLKKSAGVETKQLRVGDEVVVTGILHKGKDGFEILPRSTEDVAVTTADQQKLASSTVNAHSGITLGTIETYLTATAGGLASILVGLLARVHGAVAMAGLKRVHGAAVKIVKRKNGD